MSGLHEQRMEITRDAVRRFSHLPTRAIARYLADGEFGHLYNRDIETARTCVRTVCGKIGRKNRRKIKDKSLYRPTITEMPETWRRIRTPYHLPEGTWLVLSDLHVPFHEPLPVETAIRWGQSQKVDGVFINGDLQDCEACSYWPVQRRDFDKEVELVIDFLEFLRYEFPKAKIVYKPGNHEYRLPRLYLSKLPELANSPLAAMETLLDFEKYGIEFLDYYQMVMAGKLPIIHGHEVRHISRAVNPARGLFLRTKTYAACSHCHSTSEHTSKRLDGEYLTTWSFGCLCDLSPDWNPFGNDWNWGCAIVHVDKSGDFEVENRRILPNGELR